MGASRYSAPVIPNYLSLLALTGFPQAGPLAVAWGKLDEERRQAAKTQPLVPSPGRTVRDSRDRLDPVPGSRTLHPSLRYGTAKYPGISARYAVNLSARLLRLLTPELPCPCRRGSIASIAHHQDPLELLSRPGRSLDLLHLATS